MNKQELELFIKKNYDRAFENLCSLKGIDFKNISDDDAILIDKTINKNTTTNDPQIQEVGLSVTCYVLGQLLIILKMGMFDEPFRINNIQKDVKKYD